MKTFSLMVTALAATALAGTPAFAAPGDPVPFGEGLTFDPIVDLRVRHETVEQPTLEADALTARLRAGFEIRHAASGLALLAEGEGVLAIGDDYSAFPFAIASDQRRAGFAVVADPETIGLNRLQVQWRKANHALTLGRQRINLDDQRWVGSAGWRQDEQTFDAARAEAKLGPVALDGTYAISQRTIFGIEAGPRQAFDGEFVFLGAGAQLGPIQAKSFAYLLDYDDDEQLGPLAIANADTQTYGVRATGGFALAAKSRLSFAASYARQSAYADNPLSYAADYWLAEGGLTYAGWTLTGGYEVLGSAADGGIRRAVQTPMATLHKFNGWADVFLTTPGAGLADAYGVLAHKFDGVKALPGLNAAIAFHQFDSDAGDLEYGTEWDASLGFKLGSVGILAKYANYDSQGGADFATDVDTEKFWLQAELTY